MPAVYISSACKDHVRTLWVLLGPNQGISSDKLTINVLLHCDDLHSVSWRVDERDKFLPLPLSVHNINPAEAKINFISVTLTCFLLGADFLTTNPLKIFFLLDIFCASRSF